MNYLREIVKNELSKGKSENELFKVKCGDLFLLGECEKWII